MRTVGSRNRSEFEPDPTTAYRRGRVLDAMLRAAAIAPERGVTRGTHEHFNRVDAERRRRTASRLNGT